MKKFKLGDVVQLNSGGAPLTITSSYYERWELTCVSSGGLTQEIIVPEEAIKLYSGLPTPSHRK